MLAIAVVRKAGKFNDIPLLFIDADTPLAVRAEFNPTKLLPALEAIAVVKWFDRFKESPPVP